MVWQSFGQDGEPDYGIFALRFGSNGTVLGVEFQVNVLTFSTQWRADVAMGGMATSWWSGSPSSLAETRPK